MGFFSNLTSVIVKTALTPIAVVKDAVNVVTGEDADATKNLIQEVREDLGDAGEDLADGDL